ncbi:MAG: tRNA (N6-isopentenyl adenosine(37)-C2)-methylthiotransferase MiaB [Desulfobacterales bacterium]
MEIKSLYIHTIGCQMNVYDAEKMAAGLQALHYLPVASAAAADLILLNTCAIREKAEQKVFSYLGRLAPLKSRNPRLIVAVGGCVAQQEGRRILERAPHVDLVFGTHAIGRLPALIGRIQRDRCRLVDVAMAEGFQETAFGTPQKHSGSVSRFVTSMQGCDNYCTYCVVPYVRGREASRQPEQIIAEIEALVASGVREVTLLGQNVNSYGLKERLCSFAELLARVDAVRGLARIRFTTSHPKDLSQPLIQAFGRLPKLCNHIHLPVQSGADRVLKKMNRRYTRADYLEKVHRLREVRPDIAITSDFIAGFPGETAADFDQTLDLIRQVDFDGVFAFMYSDRPVAPAARFSDKVPEAEKKRRLQALLAAQDLNTTRKNQALIGTVQRILVDGASRKLGEGPLDDSPHAPQWVGRTTTNKIVHFSTADVAPGFTPVEPGMLIDVQIENAFAHSLKGRPLTCQAPCTGVKGENSHAA